MSNSSTSWTPSLPVSYCTLDVSCLQSKALDCFDPLKASSLCERFLEYILETRTQPRIQMVSRQPKMIGEKLIEELSGEAK